MLNEVMLLQDADMIINQETIEYYGLTYRRWMLLGTLKRVRIELAEVEARKQQGEHGH